MRLTILKRSSASSPLLASLALASAACAVLFACSARDDASPQLEQGVSRPSPSATYANPVVPHAEGGMADPGVLRAGDGRYYVVSTGGARGLYPLRVSDDLVRWEHIGYIFPAGTAPSWIDGNPWAPELHHVDGRYLAFYTAKSRDTGKMALGVAVADDPAGPYVDRGGPILAEAPIGAIDSTFFRDPLDGKNYMIWKHENNSLPPNGTPLFIQELTADGLSLIPDTKYELLRNELPWEGNLVEGPWMVARDGYYYLFYSANAYYDHRYATGVARSRERNVPLAQQLVKSDAPRLEKRGAPILASAPEDCWLGPGHGSVVEGPDGRDYFLYHAWEKNRVGGPGNPRVGLLDPIAWTDGWPSIHDGKPSLGACDGK